MSAVVDRFERAPLPHGDFWWGINAPQDVRASKKDGYSLNRRQGYREGAAPWANLRDNERHHYYGDIVESPGGHLIRKKDVASYGLVIDQESGRIRRKKKRGRSVPVADAPKARKAPKVGDAPRVLAGQRPVERVKASGVDVDRARANRERQAREWAKSLVRRDPAEWQRWLGANVPKVLHQAVVQAALAMGPAQV